MCLIVAAWLGAGLVGVAGAQGPPPTDPLEDVAGDQLDVVSEPGEETGLDFGVGESSGLTAGFFGGVSAPVAKDTDMWQLIHGTPYEGVEPVDGSVTGFDVDLFALSFRDKKLGFAGGSRCAVPPEREPGEALSSYGERVSACDGSARVPVLYRFTETDEDGELWEQVDLPGPGDGEPGYIGAIAWADDGRALAVGGSGRYPRREVGRGADESFAAWAARDPAGEGRAWLFEDGVWSELDLSEQLDEGMRGMTAVSFYQEPPPDDEDEAPEDEDQVEFGVAGALGQVWEWEDGEFTRLLDRSSPEEEFFGAGQFETRVRDLLLAPRNLVNPINPDYVVQAFGSASGCCRQDPLENVPHILAYDDGMRRQGNQTVQAEPPRWYLRQFRTDATAAEATGADTSLLPDTIYALRGTSGSIVVIASPGGPEHPREPAAAISGATSVERDGSSASATDANVWRSFAQDDRQLSRVRLVAGTGSNPRAFDWTVGDRRSTELPGLGAQGVVFATHLDREPGAQVEPVSESGAPEIDDEDRAGCGVDVSGAPQQARAVSRWCSRLYSVGAYSLNDIEQIGDHAEAFGWIVGDRGAILRMDEGALQQRAGGEPPAARVGRPREAGLTDRSSFDGFRPVADDVEAGAVPPLASQPLVKLDEPRFEPWGHWSGVGIARVVMSRDGREGWATTGVSDGDPTMFRFSDGEWERCEIVGSERGPADPACAALAEAPGAIRPGTMVRVPMEKGDDPSRQDEFEVVAVAGGNFGGRAFFRYRDGRWAKWEPEGADSIPGNLRINHIVFTTPDEGWAVGDPPQSPLAWSRFDGEQWISCDLGSAAGREACDDPEGHLPTNSSAGGSGSSIADGVSGMVEVGERVYVFGARPDPGGGSLSGTFPVIVYRDSGGVWRADEGGYDPAHVPPGGTAPPPDRGLQGAVRSLAVAEEDGEFRGWATGSFGAPVTGAGSGLLPPSTRFVRLEDGGWEQFFDPGLAQDYGVMVAPERHISVAREDGSNAFFFSHYNPSTGAHHVYEFPEDAQRFELVDSGRPPLHIVSGGVASLSGMAGAPRGAVTAMAPDGQGGFWAIDNNRSGESGTRGGFTRYTDRPPRPVFEEVASPVTDGRRVTGMAGARDGSAWLSTSSDVLYRYDRLTGWDRVRVPGWERGAVVTAPSAVNDVAVSPDGGEGVAVGPGGRVARLAPGGAVLDRAAGRACDLGEPVAPCTTGRDLRSVDVAPDGSAMAVGDRLAVLWRPAGGEFRAVARPRIRASTDILAVSMPRPDRAWVLLAGQHAIRHVFRGELSGGEWSWRSEGVEASALHDLAVDASGRGYAVGDSGLILERTPDGSWRRVPLGVTGAFRKVALPVGGGEGALVAGHGGQVLTLVDGRFRVALHSDRPLRGPRFIGGSGVSGLVLLPGLEEGQAEAWMATPGSSSGGHQLFHHAGDRGDPLLRPGGGVRAVPDAPAPRSDEITVAALGKSECPFAGAAYPGCYEMAGTTRTEEVITRRAIREIAERNRREGGGIVSVWTGDAVGAASRPGKEPLGAEAHGALRDQTGAEPLTTEVKFGRWRELVADRADRAGVPFLGAIGGQDLAETRTHTGTEATLSTASTKTGENLVWREAFQGRRGPWGDGSDPDLAGDGVSLRAVAGSALEVEGVGPLAGARTHYAVDLVRGRDPVARLVFADTSLRSMSTSEGLQEPLEPGGGQAMWLERVLCRGSGRAPTGEACTRPADLPAVVVTNTPTYSYGSGAGVETMTDAAAFEAIMMRHRVSAVVSGRIGWNARYWATAPGLHAPCPGDGYRDEPPSPGASACGEAAQGSDEGVPAEAEALADALAGAGAPAPPGGDGSGQADPAAIDPGELGDLAGEQAPVSLLPFVVASGAGGNLAGSAAGDGFWHGYSIVRLPASGDPRGVIVEQRPIYDFLHMTASERRLRPGQRVTLRGYGRAPASVSVGGNLHSMRYDRIDSDAVTHRYDLFEADPERPWLPREDASGEYVPLDPEIATVDRETGVVRAGRGQHERAYAVAVLSVGDKAASYPMVFEPRRSFRAVRSEAPPAPLPQVQPPAPVPQVAGVPAAPPPPPPPPPAAPPPPGVSTPPFPALPALPSLAPPPTIGPPSPPSPPVTPPLPTPPTFSQAAPLGIAAEVGAIGVQGSVVPPAPPPVNPAPPGGSAARKEAKQRQAATAKSEEGGQEVGEQQSHVDLADGPASDAQNMTRVEHQATRRERDRPAPSFTATASEQPSAWSRGLLYGGGLGGAALILALGWSTLRPTPRRHSPPEPAPAWARAARRR